MIEIKNLTKKFQTKDGSFTALKNVSLSIPDGDIFGVIGMSGAGKSTLVRTINMLERPTEGSVTIDGVDMGSLSPKELREMRRNITMIFQGFNLLMQRNVEANVYFPLRLEGMKKREAKAKAAELLELVGLKDKAHSYPAQLSGGQQQRVAIARALATNPKVLLCDEATSALDPMTTNSILDLIKDINEKLGVTVIIITHQMSVVDSICRHVAIIEQGEVVEQGDVQEIFTNPQTDAAKRLVFPEAEDNDADIVDHKNTLRVIFNGADAANEPMVAELALKLGIKANIAYASTKSIGDKAYGTMFLSFENEDAMKAALEFFEQTPGIIVKEA